MFVPPVDTYGRGGNYKEHVCFPIEQGLVERPVLQPAGYRSPRPSDRQPFDAVKVAAVLIDMIPEPVDSPVPTGLACVNSSINDTSPLVWQMASEDNFYMEGQSWPT